MPIRILLIDDEEDFRELFEALLSFKGYEVETAGDGRDGLRKLRENAYDVVVADYTISGLETGEFCRTIRGDAALEGMPLIIISGSFDANELRRWIGAAGADAVLEKMEVIGTIDRAIEEAIASRARRRGKGGDLAYCECA